MHRPGATTLGDNEIDTGDPRSGDGGLLDGDDEGYEKILESYVGGPESDLIGRWGPPDAAYETGGVKFLSWTDRRTIPVSGTAPSYSTSCYGANCTTTAIGGSSGYNINMSCKTVFTVAGGIVTSWRYQGNDCTA